MTTIVKLGFGIIKVTAKGVKLFVDVAQGKAPDLRIDEGESSGPNRETHSHFGDGEGSPVGEGLDFLLGAAPISYENRKKVIEQDYIFSDRETLESLRKYDHAYRG